MVTSGNSVDEIESRYPDGLSEPNLSRPFQMYQDIKELIYEYKMLMWNYKIIKRGILKIK